MNRRAFLASAAGAVALAGCTTTTGGATAGPTRRPNVLLVISDDQGYGDLGCHGNPHLRTPNIDRLHAESTRLTRFYVSPVCAPTRASLMTGRYTYRTGVVDTYQGRAMMHSDEVTLAECLRAAGYRTGIFGKWHLGDHYPLRAMDQGFEEALLHRGGGISQPSSPPGDSYFDPFLEHNGQVGQVPGYCTDIFANAAIQFIEDHADAPFFTYLATNAPHLPLQVEERYVAPYLAQGLAEPTAKVYGMIANLDENVGRVLDTLDRLQLAEHTVVIFMTDNGSQTRDADRFMAGMRGHKGTVYEGGIHVPCFVRWPGHFMAGVDVPQLAAHIDVMPTLLSACGLPEPDTDIDGTDLSSFLAPMSCLPIHRSIFLQWHRGDRPEAFKNAAVVTQQYKLVDGKELYDLEADPGEAHDLAAQLPEVVVQLRAEYEAWFADVSATRDFEPPAIHIGTPHENPTVLTAQDWRGSEKSKNSSKAFWKLQAEPGVYDVRIDLSAPAPGPVSLELRFGPNTPSAAVESGANTHTFRGVALTRGNVELAFALHPALEDIGVAYATIERV
jgi:arylsulfatase A-like enzyme